MKFDMGFRSASARCGLVAVALLACTANVLPPATTCSPEPGASAPPSPKQLVELVGEFDLILLNTQGEYGDSLIRGTLTLWPNDSARRYAHLVPALGYITGERPLVGRFESQSPTIPSYPNDGEPATPERPVVAIIGRTLYLGGIDMMDGGGARLEIRTATAEGFVGTWTRSLGMARVVDTVQKRFLQDPGGHFCALRRG